MEPAAERVARIRLLLPRPGQHEPVLGACAGHIGQPLGLLQLSFVILCCGGKARAPVGAQMQVQARLAGAGR